MICLARKTTCHNYSLCLLLYTSLNQAKKGGIVSIYDSLMTEMDGVRNDTSKLHNSRQCVSIVLSYSCCSDLIAITMDLMTVIFVLPTNYSMHHQYREWTGS